MPAIRTPDQRLRVFVSSTLHELADERSAAQEAITQLRLAPVLFELGARPHPPRMLYRAYLEQSDVFVGIYWERYGWIAPGEQISGLEDEYLLAGDRPKLIYVKSPAPGREAGLRALLQRIQEDDTTSYRRFSDAAELRELIENDLAVLLTEHFSPEARSSGTLTGTPDRPADLPLPRRKLVDRVTETALARRLLRDRNVGLVTLTGPGGSGKTRLALHVADSLRSTFADAIYFISLASLGTESEVISAIFLGLGIPAAAEPARIEQIVDRIQSKRVLLVLDNFEHLPGAAPVVNQLLEHCPRLKVLATSRAPLHVREEHELPVPPLAVPARSDFYAARDAVLQYPAVELFIARAREVDPEFAVTDATSPIAAEICSRLDGLPLAIELAAARVKVLSLPALLARLEHRLPVLSGGARDLPDRQRTLKDTIAWSYNLLNDRERALFRRLSVFAGGFDVDAAAAIWPVGDDIRVPDDGNASRQPEAWRSHDVLDGIASLLDKNLLWAHENPAGDLRFGMLETIREFALDALAGSNEEDHAKGCLSIWALGLAERALPELTGPNQVEWLQRLDLEYANLRVALEWSVGREDATEMALRLGTALWRHWWGRGYASEGEAWLARALARPWRGAPNIRARALVAAAELAEARADYQQAEAWHDEALAISRSIGDKRVEADALNGLGIVLRAKGALERAEALHEQALGILRELRDERRVASSLNNLGGIAYVRRDIDRAERLWQETLEVVQRIGDHRSTGALLGNLGVLARFRGEIGRAIALHEEALSLARSIGDRASEASALANLGAALFEQGEYDRALGAFEEALEGCRQAGEAGSEAMVLYDLGRLAEASGDLDRAAVRFAESLRIFHRIGSLPGVADVLQRVATIALRRAEPDEATRLFAAAAGIRATTGAAIDDSEHEEHLRDARAELGDAVFESLWAIGAALTVDEAVGEALAPPRSHQPGASARIPAPESSSHVLVR